MKDEAATKLPALAQAVLATGRPIYFEITPLFETAWTGIPMVTAGLARALLAVLPEQVRFFRDRHVVPPDAVAAALAQGSGATLLQSSAADALPPEAAAQALAIFPSVKPVRGVFGIECSLIHDLSTLLTPQFHRPATIRQHVQTMQLDRQSNAVTFAVSQACADDLAAYFGDDGRTFVVRSGVAWPTGFEARARREAAKLGGAPYLLVLGTREPRKNLALLFTVLARCPDLLDRVRIIIAGAEGWHLQSERISPQLRAALPAGRIIFEGYVDEFRKFQLLRGALALIYPSLFEGFGLPVLESLSVGTPAIASFSSGIPEAGGAHCRYFDPFSARSLAAALRATLQDATLRCPRRRAALRRAVAQCSWQATLAQMLERLLPLMVRR